jgi:hypothetical protein
MASPESDPSSLASSSSSIDRPSPYPFSSPKVGQQIKPRLSQQQQQQETNRPAIVTLDLLLRALNNTFLHPFIAWLLPLCLRAQATPYSHPSFIITTIYASILTFLTLLAAINRRIAYGAPREVDLSEEVVLVAGGASGIGKAIAENYGMRGVSVAVVDVKRPGAGQSGDEDDDEDMSNVRFYRCDASDRVRLEEVARRIESDVCVSLPYPPFPVPYFYSSDLRCECKG